MEKRLTRSDFVFILVFIFMLIFALAAFFYGMRIGTDRTEAKYAELIKQKEEESKGLTAYHQSYLVSFYHTVYLPFREFNLKWDQSMKKIAGGGDGSALLKELSELADEKYNAMLTQTMPETSPLLKEGHQNYLKSLKLFSQAGESMQSKANRLAPSALVTEIDKDAYFNEAKNFALAAQKNYFDSIVLWHQSLDQSVQPETIQEGDLAFKEWGQLNLNLKNAYISGVLLTGERFGAYTPQDVTLRVDEMIQNNNGKKFNASNIPEVVDILMTTPAVRPGDFVQEKTKYYTNELLPQLPFFTAME